MAVCTFLKRLVPRAGVEPARPYGQRILSLLRGYSQHSTTRYQVVFTDVSAVKASYVWLGPRILFPSSRDGLMLIKRMRWWMRILDVASAPGQASIPPPTKCRSFRIGSEPTHRHYI